LQMHFHILKKIENERNHKFRHWWIHLQNKTAVSLISPSAPQDPVKKILDQGPP
jgi:hypothetical protein